MRKIDNGLILSLAVLTNTILTLLIYLQLRMEILSIAKMQGELITNVSLLIQLFNNLIQGF